MKRIELIAISLIAAYFIAFPIYSLTRNVEAETITRQTIGNEIVIKTECATEPQKQPITDEFIGYDIPITYEEQSQIKTICEVKGIDFELLLAIADVESRFDNNAIGDNGNSLGMFQIQPRWWEKLYNKNNDLDLFNTVDSAEACCVVLNYLYENYQDTTKVLQAYNSGNPNYENGYAERVYKAKSELKKGVQNGK